MNKKLLIFLVISITSLMSVQALTIDRPAGTDTWQAGTSRNIVWTSSERADRPVKIRLFNEAGLRILSITDSTENDGTFRWSIPSTLRPGRYVVRVRALNNSFSDDSALFRILEARTLIVATEMNYETKFKKDIEVTDIWVKDNCQIWVKYRNNGIIKIDQVLKSEIWVNGVMVENAGEHLIMNAGTTHQHELSAAGKASRFTSKTIKVVVDSNNTFTETNETNNVLEKRVRCKSWLYKGKK